MKMPFKNVPWRKSLSANKIGNSNHKKSETQLSNKYNHSSAHLTKIDLLKPIPSFQETPEEKKADVFIHKLKLCQIMFDWESETDTRAKDVKRQELLGLVDYIGKNKNIYSKETLAEVIRMVSVNLFRTLPPKVHKLMPEGDEDPVFDQSWHHLQAVYEFFLRFIISNDVEVKVLKKYITPSFVLNILNLINSEDHRERDYLKTILHRIYAKFMLLRSFIRKQISHIFSTFVWETERHDGIPELLEILGSIINGFALPLKEEHVFFLKKILLPMHKVKFLSVFHQQLSYCVTQFVDKDPTLAVPVINALLKYWPRRSSSKGVLFLNELEELLELTQPEEFKLVLAPLFNVLVQSFGSLHFQVAERSLFYFHNEYISGLIADHRAKILPIIYPILDMNAQQHWNQTVNDLTVNVLKIFTELDQPLVEKCSNAYTDSFAKKLVHEKARKQVWIDLKETNKRN